MLRPGVGAPLPEPWSAPRRREHRQHDGVADAAAGHEPAPSPVWDRQAEERGGAQHAAVDALVSLGAGAPQGEARGGHPQPQHHRPRVDVAAAAHAAGMLPHGPQPQGVHPGLLHQGSVELLGQLALGVAQEVGGEGGARAARPVGPAALGVEPLHQHARAGVHGGLAPASSPVAQQRVTVQPRRAGVQGHRGCGCGLIGGVGLPWVGLEALDGAGQPPHQAAREIVVPLGVAGVRHQQPVHPQGRAQVAQVGVAPRLGVGGQAIFAPGQGAEAAGLFAQQPVQAALHGGQVAIRQRGMLQGHLPQAHHRHGAGAEGPLRVEQGSPRAVGGLSRLVKGPGGHGVRQRALGGELTAVQARGPAAGEQVEQREDRGEDQQEEAAAHGSRMATGGAAGPRRVAGRSRGSAERSPSAVAAGSCPGF